jgi:hypothetical protein
MTDDRSVNDNNPTTPTLLGDRVESPHRGRLTVPLPFHPRYNPSTTTSSTSGTPILTPAEDTPNKEIADLFADLNLSNMSPSEFSTREEKPTTSSSEAPQGRSLEMITFQADKIMKVKILNGVKLSKDNWERWFKSFDRFLIMNKLKPALAVKVSDEVFGSDQFEMIDAFITEKIDESIEETDQQALFHYQTCGEKYEALKNRYNDQRQSLTSEMIQNFFNFRIDDEKIKEAHAKLLMWGNTIASRNPAMKSITSEEEVFNRLLDSLPSAYEVIRDRLRGDKSPVNERLMILYEKEASMKSESANFSRERVVRKTSSQRLDRHRRRTSSSSSSSDGRRRDKNSVCHLCGKSDHRIARCPDIDEASKFLKSRSRSRTPSAKPQRSYKSSSRSEKESRSHSAEKRVHWKDKRPGGRSKAYVAGSDSGGEDDDSDPEDDAQVSSESEMESGHIAAEAASEEDQEDASDDEDDAYETAFEGDDEEEAKTTAFHAVDATVKKNTSTSLSKPPADWIPDTGASSHMTDRRDLFEKDPTVNERGNRKVRVGGGALPILGRGTVRTAFKLSPVRLKSVLYVPRLGANLLSRDLQSQGAGCCTKGRS